MTIGVKIGRKMGMEDTKDCSIPQTRNRGYLVMADHDTAGSKERADETKGMVSTRYGGTF